jgi:uroporphyrinogen-III synthase
MQKAEVAVLVTRSGKSGEQLTDLLKSEGYQSCFTPTLKIIKESLLLPAEDYQQAIFVSQNAVKYSVERSQLVKDLLPTQLIAVGEGTAARLEQNGFDDVIIPESSNTEGLLELSSLQSIKGQQILLIKGRGGRELLEKTLSDRGAICYPLEVYSRVTEVIDETLWHEFLTTAIENEAASKKKRLLNIITLASVEALEALKAYLMDEKVAKLITLVVASERIAKKAAQYRVKDIHVAASATNDAAIVTINNLVNAATKSFSTENY